MDYLISNQFATVIIIHLLGVMSPGPDFLLVLKQSLSEGRKSALYTSIGIGLGILVHVILCVFGLGILISNTERIYGSLLALGSIFIIYLGIQSLLDDKISLINVKKNKDSFQQSNSLIKGFLTNILNPKATLFFLSVYSLVIDETTVYIQLLYGLWMSFATICWFSFLSFLLTANILSSRLEKFNNLIKKIMGIVFILVGVRILIINFL